jgi:hypothetical protein
VLSVAKCRELLGESAPEDDRDVEVLRDQVTAIVEMLLDSLSKAPKRAEQEAG